MSKTVQFTDTSTNANTYYWQFGDGNASGDRNPIHTYEEYGDYVVILTITDNNGNSDEFQQNVSLSLPNVDEPPVDETIEEETTEETTDEEEVTNETEVIYGCTDPTATNYNPNATQENGSCQYNSEQETTSTEPRPTNPPSGYNPLFGNFKRGATSPERQWIWSGFIWNANPNYELVEEEEEEVIVREERDEIVVNRRRPRDNIRETTRGY